MIKVVQISIYTVTFEAFLCQC